MEKTNPLQPFWYDGTRVEDANVLSVAPKDKKKIDADAGGTRFHTRNVGIDIPTKKRSIDQRETDTKRRTFDTSGLLNSDFLLTSDDSQFNTASKRVHISSHPSYTLSSESVYNFQPNEFSQRIPSSPPNNSNELGISSQMNYKDDGEHLFTSQATMIPMSIEDESDDSDTTVNFNVTPFNRVHGYVSSESLAEDHYTNEEELNLTAKGIFNQCIEEGKSQVHLENLGLKTIPDDIEDFKNLISIGKNGIEAPNIEIYAMNNKLKILPPTLFNISNITVLSLRDNKLKKIPGKIQQLQKLTDLSIVSNEIRVVPYQILKLPNLVNLLVRPNYNLIELNKQDPLSYYCVNDENLKNDVDLRRFVSKLKFIDTQSLPMSSQVSNPKTDREALDEITTVPKLSELCLRNISKYSVTHSETKKWKKNIGLPIQLKIAKAFQKGIYDETCSVCNSMSINPVAKALEWWDFKSQKLIPVRRNFCCGACVKQWLDEVEECRLKYDKRIIQ